ncbi:MAG: glycine--tRNA ligase subunit beta [Cycloclasticus sp. symbiont of Poecilosclerida sp. N]|nr:MAG: glycine--tRNA ligase subunit beta [Cycloclasticus sp. symbiont of Poecilosclerida sp. N]
MSVTKDLLFELGCEELPPTALKILRDSLLSGVCAGLNGANLNTGKPHAFATPRRLAVWIEAVETTQADELVEKRGPAIAAAYDKEGNPSKAGLGFARGCGVEFNELETLKTDKGDYLSYKKREKGQTAEALIPAIIETALNRLPIAKRMRWGRSDNAFVRPVHWVVLMLGNDVIKSRFFGINASNTSVGHRFHAPETFTITTPSAYSAQLSRAHVIASFEERQSLIEKQAIQAAGAVNGEACMDADLLDEITALVEFPVAVTGRFDEHFLALPKEVLITTMQINQKYFPVLDANGSLLPYFITISNIQSSNPASVSHGNERVISPRLSDAEFFWRQDMKSTLADRVASLDHVVFQHKLGSVGAKTRRVETLSIELANQLGCDATLASRAALLSKADLVTNMVGEFASLQGVIGRYYAIENGEASEVAMAIQEQYLPKQAGGDLPVSKTGQILALSDKLDTVVGIFSVGLIPTGDKDPFALRRASLGILRVLIEHGIQVDLKSLISLSCRQFSHDFDEDNTKKQVLSFILERLRGYCLANGFSSNQFAAVTSIACTEPVDFINRLRAVKEFSLLEEASSLGEANKRIQNLLKKAPADISKHFDAAILADTQEVELYQKLLAVEEQINPLLRQHKYTEALKALSTLKEPIDAFFEHVFIMADDEKVKSTRLALLSKIRTNFIKIADVSMI